jgi:hypothetical protein
MNAMNQSALYNLSGCVIPDNAKIEISGAPKPGDVLVIESFDGTKGTANWRTLAELKARRAQRQKETSTPDARPAWCLPLKPKAPYS